MNCAGLEGKSGVKNVGTPDMEIRLLKKVKNSSVVIFRDYPLSTFSFSLTCTRVIWV
jgi:hypothetical protein